MLFWLSFACIFIVLIFGLVVFIGPPYLPTLRKQITTALDLLDLKEGETLLELGSGDGRVMRMAAQRGLRAVGIEINPFLVIVSYIVTWRYRKQVRIIWGSYWGTPWPRADGIFTFILGKYMGRLDERIEKWRPERRLRLASFAFTIPDRVPVTERNGVYLYEYK
jgi:hypothetical protein